MNILQIIGVVLRHVQDYKSVKDVLEEAKARAERIYANIQEVKLLPDVESVLSYFINETVEEFERIRDELLFIQEKVMNRPMARSVLASPATLAQLNEISSCLKQKEQNIKLMGMIAKLDVGLQSCAKDVKQGFTKVLVKLNTQSEDVRLAKAMLCHVCRMRLLNSEGRWIEEIDSEDKLATGIAFYEGNRSVRKDFQKAARYLNSALNAGNSEAYYYLGMMHRSGSGVQKCNLTAFEYFEKGTRAKDPKSMAQLSVAYWFGEGVELNDPLACAYAKMSAEAGDPFGMFLLAEHKLYGIITDKNLSVAYDYTKKALEKGYKKAKMTLAMCYFHGLSVEQDLPNAIQLWLECIEGGGYSCVVDLAPCYEHGLGVDVDLQKAAELYKMGSEMAPNLWRRQYIQAFYGLCLIRGRGVMQDVKKGWSLIRESVQANKDTGWFAQGECYRYGYGVKRNLDMAIQSYNNAIRVGDDADGRNLAHYALGTMYEAGEGLDRDYSKAFENYNYSADVMHHDAQWKIALSCESGIGVERNIARAVEYFRLAANGGHRDSQIKSYNYYMEGKGVQRNLMSSAQVIEAAAESGDKKAKRLLRRLVQKRIRFRLFKSSRVSIWSALFGSRARNVEYAIISEINFFIDNVGFCETCVIFYLLLVTASL